MKLDTYSKFEQGERQALLDVRSFIIKPGTKEVDAFCAQRLHDIRMDARPRAATLKPTACVADSAPLGTATAGRRLENVGIPTEQMSE